MISLVLTRYSDDIFAVLGLSMIICGILEYFTSYIMEKLFNARWWDYSNEKFNINGRICLETLILFGIAGIVITKFLNPFFIKGIEQIPSDTLNVLSWILFVILFIDVIVSLNVMNKIKDISFEIGREFKDNTEEISKRVRNTIQEKSLLYRRILEAFPQAFATKVKQSKEKIIQAAADLKSNVIEAKDRTIENINIARYNTINNMYQFKERAVYGVNSFKEKASNKFENIKTSKSLNYYANSNKENKKKNRKHIKHK